MEQLLPYPAVGATVQRYNNFRHEAIVQSLELRDITLAEKLLKDHIVKFVASWPAETSGPSILGAISVLQCEMNTDVLGPCRRVL